MSNFQLESVREHVPPLLSAWVLSRLRNCNIDCRCAGTVRVALFTASDLGHVGTLRVALFTASDLGPILCCLPPLRHCVKDHSQKDSPAEMGSPRQLRWKVRPRNVGDGADDIPVDTRPFGTLQPPFPSCDLL